MSKSLAFPLVFERITCFQCGIERLSARSCNDCGAAPKEHETQVHVDRRKTILERFQEERRPVIRQAFPADPLAEIQTALEDVFAAFRHVGKGERNVTLLVDAFEKLDQLKADTSVLLLRPSRNSGRQMHRCASEVVSAAETFLSTLVATDIYTAQELSYKGNAQLEDAFAHLEENRSELLSAQAADGSVTEALGRDHAMREEMTRRKEAKHSLVAQNGQFDRSLAVDALDIATTLLDALEVENLSESLASSLMTNPTVLTNDELQQEFAVTLSLLDNEIHTFQETINNHEGDLAIVNRAVTLAALGRERGYRFGLRVLLAANGQCSLEEARSWNAGQTIKHAIESLPVLRLHRIDRQL